MTSTNIYQDIAARTGGDIYIGVVGPVRTGKSTFIKQFMDCLVLPNITEDYQKERANDELPQSSSGRTIMTTEPKFIPEKGVEIKIDNTAAMNVRLIDCVGYIVPSALGYIEGDQPRMVHTPWFEDPIPFNMAAEIGTQKVITEHSTIGLVVTTDGTITELDRADYVDAETRVIDELKAINKPFIIVLNSTSPESAAATELKNELSEKYDVPVVAVNCEHLSPGDIHNIIETVLFEFPLSEINIDVPAWLEALPPEHQLKSDIYAAVIENMQDIYKIRDTRRLCNGLSGCRFIGSADTEGIDLGQGTVKMKIALPRSLFYQVLGEQSGFEISDEESLITLMAELGKMKKEYDKISYALHEVREKGYGIVSPSTDELTLDEPKIVKQGGRFGVRLRASAPSIHMTCNKPKFLKTA